MEKELTLYQLGNLLKAVTENYEVSLMSKIKLSGGWMTITGNIDVDYIPTNEVLGKGSNIIGLKINNNGSCANDIKIIGMKDLNFKVNLAATKFKEIHKGGLNLDKIKEKADKCTLKIDENMIFTINASLEEVKELL